jgi:hypothetical protein
MHKSTFAFVLLFPIASMFALTGYYTAPDSLR